MITIPNDKAELFSGLAKNPAAYKALVDILETARAEADQEFTRCARIAVYDNGYTNTAIEQSARAEALGDVIELLNTNRLK